MSEPAKENIKPEDITCTQHHGGCRIFWEHGDDRKLLVDSYYNAEFGRALDTFVRRYFGTPAPLPDNVREAVDKKSMAIHAAELNLLNLYGEDRGDAKDYNAMTLLSLYRKAVERWVIALNTTAPTTGQRKETDDK